MGIQCAASVLPNFNLKTLEGKSRKKKEKEPFQHEILRTTSVLPNFNLETLRRESQKKKGEGTIPTRNSKCCFCSPKFQSKNAGNREQRKKKKHHSNKKFNVLLLFSRISI